MDIELLKTRLKERFSGVLQTLTVGSDMLSITVNAPDLYELCKVLRDESGFEFQQLMDVTAVDYLAYGKTEWATESTTLEGFSRGVMPETQRVTTLPARFAVVYHLLSLSLNQRLRIKTYIDEANLQVMSLCALWPSANWFEREVYDLFGITFTNHPDLRRILTDYGFVGHPFRKDFPLSGHVEVHYDAALGRVVYGPVEIPERTLVPKVIRHDNRYIKDETSL